MYQDSSSDNGEQGPFRVLLCKAIEDVNNGREPNEFFENDLYVRKGKKICRVHRLEYEDPGDVWAEIQIKVLKGLPKFKLNDELPFDGFFIWVRRMARNRRIDILRASRAKTESVDDHVDDLKDDSINPNKRIDQTDLLKEFNRCVELMSTKERLAFMCIKVLELPSRVAAVILTSAGFPCTHTTAIDWASDALRRYFQETAIERKESARAGTRAKKTSRKEQAAS